MSYPENFGWIKIHRKLVKWEWYDDIPTFRIFMHLLITANFKETRYLGRILPAGTVVTGSNKLATETGLSRQQTRTALNKLKSTNEITIEATNKYTIITICKYDTYQKSDEPNQPTNNQPSTNHQPTSNQPSTNHQPTINHNKENVKNVRMKESKNVKKARAASVFAGEQVQSDFEQSLINLMKSIPVPQALDSAKFRIKIFAFNLMWADRDKRLPALQTIEQQYRKLIDLKAEGHDALKVIDHAIEGGTRRFFPPPEQKDRQPQTQGEKREDYLTWLNSQKTNNSDNEDPKQLEE